MKQYVLAIALLFMFAACDKDKGNTIKDNGELVTLEADDLSMAVIAGTSGDGATYLVMRSLHWPFDINYKDIHFLDSDGHRIGQPAGFTLVDESGRARFASRASIEVDKNIVIKLYTIPAHTASILVAPFENEYFRVKLQTVR